jgi:hypothetical protein
MKIGSGWYNGWKVGMLYAYMCGLTLSIGQVEYGIQGQYMCCYNNSLLCMKLTLYVMYVNIWVQYCEPEVYEYSWYNRWKDGFVSRNVYNVGKNIMVG